MTGHEAFGPAAWNMSGVCLFLGLSDSRIEMRTVISDGRVITPSGVFLGYVVLEDGRISEIGRGNAPSGNFDERIDAEGDYVSPGFIDMHTHGAGGADFMDGTVDAYLAAARMHAIHGTTLLYPTTATSSKELLFESLDTYRKASAADSDGAAFGGMHLEGPYFSPRYAGAQDPRYLKHPVPEEYEDIIARGRGIIKRWSFAPELEGAPAFAAALKKNGILASVGHTSATFEQCHEAFLSGATHMTHFFCCMSTVTRKDGYRTAGVMEYGYYQDGMTVEIIADGCHIPESLLKMIVRIKGVDRVALVTDSMRGAGMPEGVSILGGLSDGREVIIEDGVAKMPDRSCFAGSVATTDRLVRTMVNIAGCSIEDAVRMVSANPSRIMGIDGTKGTLELGKDADIVLFDDDICVKRTIINGKTMYQSR